MSVKKTILVLCVILCTARQVSSFKCYICTSTYGEDCYKNPKKPVFEKNCPETARNSGFKSSNITDFPLLSALLNDSITGDSAVSYASSTTHDCCTLKGTILGIEGVIRSCHPKTLSNEDITKAATTAGMTVKSLERCDNDLCNSSDAPATPSSVPPVISTTNPPSSTQKPSPSSSSKPSSAPSSTHSPIPSTTNAPNSSRALNNTFLSLASSLFLIYFIKL